TPEVKYVTRMNDNWEQAVRFKLTGLRRGARATYEADRWDLKGALTRRYLYLENDAIPVAVETIKHLKDGRFDAIYIIPFTSAVRGEMAQYGSGGEAERRWDVMFGFDRASPAVINLYSPGFIAYTRGGDRYAAGLIAIPRAPAASAEALTHYIRPSSAP